MEMKVDSDRVRSERERRAWSQEQPTWVKAMLFGSQWIDMGKRQHERLEAVYAVLGVVLSAIGVLGLFNVLVNSGEPFLVSGLVFFTLAYVATLNVRIGERYDVWPRAESRAAHA